MDGVVLWLISTDNIRVAVRALGTGAAMRARGKLSSQNRQRP